MGLLKAGNKVTNFYREIAKLFIFRIICIFQLKYIENSRKIRHFFELLYFTMHFSKLFTFKRHLQNIFAKYTLDYIIVIITNHV